MTMQGNSRADGCEGRTPTNGLIAFGSVRLQVPNFTRVVQLAYLFERRLPASPESHQRIGDTPINQRCAHSKNTT
jgi:hypothetical protein